MRPPLSALMVSPYKQYSSSANLHRHNTSAPAAIVQVAPTRTTGLLALSKPIQIRPNPIPLMVRHSTTCQLKAQDRTYSNSSSCSRRRVGMAMGAAALGGAEPQRQSSKRQGEKVCSTNLQKYITVCVTSDVHICLSFCMCLLCRYSLSPCGGHGGACYTSPFHFPSRHGTMMHQCLSLSMLHSPRLARLLVLSVKASTELSQQQT